jgi:ubiquinone/menaquinone biosynthesis C-methylase UbiE
MRDSVSPQGLDHLTTPLDPEQICEANCELFGKHAAYFESEVVPLWQGVYDQLVARAGISPGFKVLDIGTGPGEVALRVAGLIGPHGSVVGIDVAGEMLEIARGKAMKRGLANADFRQMSAERLDFPDATFDAVLGNYSLCCCYDYGQALKECLRALKPGGRLTYNHSGPDDPPALVIAYELFDNYKTKSPSKKLQGIREADEAQAAAMEKYLHPKVAVNLMKKLGYWGAKSASVRRVVSYNAPGDFIDRMLNFSWASEADEISPDALQRFRKESIEALKPLTKGPGLTVEDEMIFFTGRKAAL